MCASELERRVDGMDCDRLLEERRSTGVLRDECRASNREGIGGSPNGCEERLHLRHGRGRRIVPTEQDERLHEQLVRKLVGIPDIRAPDQPVHLLDELDRSLAASEREITEREVEQGVPAEPVEPERGGAIYRQSCMLVAAVV